MITTNTVPQKLLIKKIIAVLFWSIIGSTIGYSTTLELANHSASIDKEEGPTYYLDASVKHLPLEDQPLEIGTFHLLSHGRQGLQKLS